MPMATPALQLHRGIRLSMAEQLLLLASRAWYGCANFAERRAESIGANLECPN
ncbi:hypothetical protein FB007_15210 [Sinorhizobium medicae]|nr:hypothetical protein FB007_15210 [Sinorhizobium medicae]